MTEEGDLESLKVQWREQALQAVSRASAEGEQRGREVAEAEFALQEQVQAERIRQLELIIADAKAAIPTSTSASNGGASTIAQKEVVESIKKAATKRAKSFLSEVFTLVQSGVNDADNAESFLAVVRSVLVGEVESLTGLFHDTVDNTLLAATPNNSGDSGGPRSERFADAAVQTTLDPVTPSSPLTSFVVPGSNGSSSPMPAPSSPFPFPTITENDGSGGGKGGGGGDNTNFSRAVRSEHGGHNAPLAAEGAAALSLSSAATGRVVAAHPPRVCVWPAITEATQERDGLFGGFTAYKVCSHISSPPPPPPPPLAVVAAHPASSSSMPQQSFLKFPAPHDMHSFPMPPDSKVQSRRKFATSAQTAITMNASKRYSEFERLHGELTKSAAASSPVCQVVFLPPLPSKRMVARALSSDLSSDNALVAQRQQQLALWLQYATAHPQLLRQKALAAFCCGSKAAVPLAWLTAINAKDEAEVEAVPPFQNSCVEPHTTSSDPRAAAAAAPSASSSPPPRLPSSRSPSTANDMTSNQLLVFGPQLAEQELKRTTAEVASLLPCVERALESSRKLRDAFSDGTAAEQAFATTLAVGEMSSSSSSTISFSASSSAFQSSSFSPPSSSSSSSSSPPLTPVGDDDGRKARPPLSSASATPPTPPSLSHSWDFDLERSLLASSAGFGLLASARCRALCAQAFSKHAVEPLRFHCRSCLPAAQQGIERARKEKPRPPPPPPTAAATAAAAASLSSSSSEDRGGGGGGGRGGGGGGSSSEAAATQHMSKVSGAVQNEWKLMGQLRGASLCLGLSDACHEMERACREEAKAWETALETLLQTPLPDMVLFTADLGDVLLSASSGISSGISATSNNTTTAPTAISSSSSSLSSPLPPFAAANADTREAVSTPPEPSLGKTPAAVPGSSSGSGSSNNTAAAATALSSPFQHAATALPPKEPSLPVPVPRNGHAPTAAATASTARQEPAPPPPVPPAPRRLQPTATTATANGGDQPVVVAVAVGGGQEGAGEERGRGRERRSSAGASATAASVSFAASPAEFPAAPSTGRTTRGSSEAPRPVASSSSARGGAAAATAEASISGRTTRGRSAGATKGRGVSTERARRATTPVTTTAAAAARATDMSRAYESRAEAFAAAQAEREEEKRRVAEKRMTEAQAAMAEAEDLRKNRRGVAYQNNGANKNPTRLQRAGGSSSSSSSNNTGSTSSSANSSSASNSASAVASKANQQNQQPQPSAAAVAAAAAAATKTPPSPEHPAAPSSSSLSSSPFEGKLPPVHPSLAPNHSRPTTATTMKAKSTAAAAGAAASTTGASRTRNNSGGSTNKAFPPSANQTFPNATTAANSASAAAASLSAQAPPMAPSPSQEPPSSSLSLPPGWEEVTQGGGKASYFFHHVLRVSRWERPSPQLAAEIEARLAAEAAARTHAEEKRKAAVDAQATAVAQAKEKGEVLKRDAETKVKAWMAASSSSQSASNGKLCSNNRPFSELLADLPAALPFAPKLQLAPGASSAEVKKAYMKAARAIHPDKVVIGQALPGGAGIVDLEAAIRAEVLFTALAAMYEDFKAT